MEKSYACPQILKGKREIKELKEKMKNFIFFSNSQKHREKANRHRKEQNRKTEKTGKAN